METFHMILILLMVSPFSQAWEIVNNIYLPMVVANAIGMLIFAIMINNVIKNRKYQN